MKLYNKPSHSWCFHWTELSFHWSEWCLHISVPCSEYLIAHSGDKTYSKLKEEWGWNCMLLIFQEPAMNGTRLHTHNLYNFFKVIALNFQCILCWKWEKLKLREVHNYSKSTFFRQRICTGAHDGKERPTTRNGVLTLKSWIIM